MRFDFKHLSPSQVAAILALSIATLVALANLLVNGGWKLALIYFTLLFLVSYGLIFYFLQRFIYRRIKLIYKFIYQTKASKREEFYNKYIIPQKSIDEVKDDVEKWAAQREGEIQVLKR
ncbi:MAG TPA: sensor histidine kinase, partial [Flavihumibacter sp.]|nr:sensor histidine kinase [Flavihumibacter sp.]